ncbi:DNA methyltransferase [Pseudactinotalea sp. Z1748]|uniref:DNA methyltransferase n=1 Tax=Pseudactinotalea sp. Z1748 TaxID=3413027 RepID=UPI003C7B7965
MSATLAYEDFLREKVNFDTAIGFDVDPAEVHPSLKPHQSDIVRWAAKGGRRAIFAAFGLGKSVMQLETLRLTLAKSGRERALIICPLGVRIEFAHDARQHLGLETRFIRRDEEVDGPGIYITNYESVRDGRLDPTLFDAVSLDEASVLRSYGSKTYQTFLALFEDVPYRFVATATPSPNRHKELIHYAGYLGIMDTGQSLTRFFQRDSTQANNLQLYPHKEQEFWLWLNTWAAFVQSPADLGHDATGYDLPERHLHEHKVSIDLTDDTFDRDGQGGLFRNAALGLKEAAREKRDSLPVRVEQMMRIVREHRQDNPGDQIVLWCDLNAEQAAIEAALKAEGITYSSVYGSLHPDETERRLGEWKARETYALIGKPVMLGQGMNLQQCNTAVFVGITYKFNDIIQATHRIHRFGQTRPTRTHLIYADSESEVMQAIRDKWHQHEELSDTMTSVIREYGLDPEAIAGALTRSMGVERIEATGEGWLAANNDCVPETRSMDTNSVDMVLTSIPFSNHYEYTPSYNDFGHTDDNAHFWAQMDHLTPELLRVLKPGRIYACHVKDRINFGNVTGAGIPTVSPFHAEAIYHGIKHGFDYMGMITVVTDVVRENNQTYRLGWSENAKDGTKMGVGSPEYVLLFHKPQTDRTKGYADVPVVKDKADYTRARWQVDAHAFWRSSGNRHLTPDELAALPVEDRSRLFTEQTLREVYDYEAHIKVGEALEGRGALPATFMSLAPGSWHPEVWHDVNRMLTLNGEQKRRNVQMHVCPLQFDIVDRLITRYTNPGDEVYDPFSGLMTVPLRALKLGRRGRGAELNTGYFLDGVKHLQAEERQRDMPTLFDLEVAS